jgi:hypothetical protein
MVHDTALQGSGLAAGTRVPVKQTNRMPKSHTQGLEGTRECGM